MFGLQYVLIPAVTLVIPVAIMLGHRRPAGLLLVCAGGALGAFAVFWLLLGGINSLYSPVGLIVGPVGPVVFFGGLLLLIAAWVLALHTAAQARHGRWVALLIVAGYLSFAAIVFSIATPDRCMFGLPSSEGLSYSYCAGNPLAQLLVLAGYLAGPAAALAYGLPNPRSRILGIRTLSLLRALRLRPHKLPEGLSVSPLSADSDAELEGRSPRM